VKAELEQIGTNVSKHAPVNIAPRRASLDCQIELNVD
jgi:hypothetical protein